MGGIANGIAYHGGFIPYCATFLTFSDYMRGSVRLAALSGLHVIYVWTHDSVGLGEDGPTHQPVEHYAALRAIPNLWFVRPGDANETAAAWALAVERTDGPVALALTRQKLPTLAGTAELAREGVARGGYVLREASGGTPELILIATGSELQLAFAAAETLEARGHPDPRRVAPVLGAVRAPGPGLSRRGPAAGRPASGSASRSASRSAGSAGSATRARSSGSTTSARRRRPARSSRSSASPPTASPTSPGGSCATACAAGSRRSTAATSAPHPTIGERRGRRRPDERRRTPATADPRATLDRAILAHARRLRRRPRRGRAQGRAAAPARRRPASATS